MAKVGRFLLDCHRRARHLLEICEESIYSNSSLYLSFRCLRPALMCHSKLQSEQQVRVARPDLKTDIRSDGVEVIDFALRVPLHW